jgi:hypothetical protein
MVFLNHLDYVAGELEIISSNKTKIDERNTRLSLLKKIVYITVTFINGRLY